jgi:hypothetical protein
MFTDVLHGKAHNQSLDAVASMRFSGFEAVLAA